MVCYASPKLVTISFRSFDPAEYELNDVYLFEIESYDRSMAS